MATRDRPWPGLAEAHEVWLVKPSSLGDVVHALPALGRLKHNWPGLRARWVVNTEWRPLLEGNPLLEEVIEFPRGRFRGLRGVGRAVGWLRQLGDTTARPVPDGVLDLQGLLRSALIAKASGAKWIAGLSDAREGAGRLQDFTADTSGILHAVDRCLALVDAFGASPGGEDADLLPRGELPAVPLAADFVLVHPWSRGRGKSLAPAAVERLAAALAPRSVVIVGRSDPAPLTLPATAIDLTGRTTLTELIGLMRRAAGVVSVDSGPMHIASALRRPLIGLHTWSDPRRVGPWFPGALVWKGGHLLSRHEVDASLAARREAPGPADIDVIASRLEARLAGAEAVSDR